MLRGLTELSGQVGSAGAADPQGQVDEQDVQPDAVRKGCSGGTWCHGGLGKFSLAAVRPLGSYPIRKGPWRPMLGHLVGLARRGGACGLCCIQRMWRDSKDPITSFCLRF